MGRGPVVGAKCALWKKTSHGPPIETLACPYADRHLYSKKKGATNLTVRKVYAKDRIRYLRCRSCSRESSQSAKDTALFNSKIGEKKAISVAEHLSEGVSRKGTPRLVGVSTHTGNKKAKEEPRGSLKEGSPTTSGSRTSRLHIGCRWMSVMRVREEQEGALLGSDLYDRSPKSRLLIGFVGGRRNETLIKELMESTEKRLKKRSQTIWS